VPRYRSGAFSDQGVKTAVYQDAQLHIERHLDLLKLTFTDASGKDAVYVLDGDASRKLAETITRRS
jgi:hypothetical protein